MSFSTQQHRLYDACVLDRVHKSDRDDNNNIDLIRLADEMDFVDNERSLLQE